jgi:thiol:disulfide interchange protein/DsbC/DsbD-like thiol-disulfide interchange protein
MKTRFALGALLAFVLPYAGEAQPPAHTKLTLIADVRTVRPGTTFMAGLVMTMDPGWHTYWKNPGDAGIPTQLKWTLPPGLTAGEILWPVPEKKIDPGDVLFYGYAHENMLLIPLTVANTVTPGGNLILKLSADWLECEATCIPGEGTASLSLPVKDVPPEPDNVTRFERYRKLLPHPPGEKEDVVITSSVSPTAVTITVRGVGGWAKTSPLDFYPELLAGGSAGRTEIAFKGNDAVVTIPYSAFDNNVPPKVLRGVLLYQLTGKPRNFLSLEIPLAVGATSDTGTVTGKSLLDRTFIPTGGGGENTSLGLYLLFALFGGLLLNIMPCVLPVIALKIFGLVKMAGDHPGRVKKLGWMFTLGIIASFLSLALVIILLQFAGQQVGWGFQFQEPLFVIIMCGVVFMFGLSLFGVFEIQLPGAAVAGVSGAIAKQDARDGGYTASFLEGVFATILATPCTAPFLGTALGFAFAQPWWMILLIFTTVALGMALPYLLLTSKPAWMKFLPKPGAWMETAKQFMGFFMMATLLWLLYVLGKQMGMEAVIWTGAFLLTVGIASWLIGRFATLSARRRTYYLAWVAAIAIVVFGYVVFVGPLREAQQAVAGTSTPAAGEGIAWQSFSSKAVAEYLDREQSVFIDFTAEWCLTCKVNERTVLADHEVIDRFKSSGIIPFRADWTNRNPEITQLLAKFGRSGVPLYVVFPAGKADQPIILPEVITKSIILDALAKSVRENAAM